MFSPPALLIAKGRPFLDLLKFRIVIRDKKFGI